MTQLLLHNKSYLMLWLSTLTTRFGNALTITVLMYHIGSQSQNPMLISLVLFAQMVPMIMIGPVAGSAADRMPKYTVMIGSEIFQLLAVAAMIPCMNAPALLICLIFLQGLGAAFYGPAKTAYLTEIVDRQKLTDAIGLSQGTSQATDLIGPPVAGALLLLIPSGGILMIDMVTFLLSAVFIFASGRLTDASRRPIPAKIKERFRTATIQGLRKVSALPALKFLIIIVFVLMFAAGVFNATAVAIELQVFHVSGLQYGLLEAVSGIGAITGSFTGPVLIRHIHPGRFIIVSGILLGVWIALIFFVQFFYPVSGLLPLFLWITGIGVLNSCLNIPVSSLFLIITPENFRGRASGLLQMFSFLGCVIGLLTGGSLAVSIGVIHVTILSGIVMATVSASLIGTKGYKHLITMHREERKSSSPIV